MLLGVAWPYANGGLHLGHVAGSLLPPDIFRRAMRMLGHDVLMVSGSDCHGTPILLKAEAEGKTPADVVEHFHRDHVRALSRLGIGFDLFTRTTTENHTRHVQEIFLACQEMGYIEKRTQKAPFDPQAGRFLPDRYVEGTLADKAPAKQASPQPPAASGAGTDGVRFEDFQRLDLRIATIVAVEPHPKADKLYVLRLDVGSLGPRQVVAGLRPYYQPSELEGQTVAFVANLEPAVLRGVESQGMILAADHDGIVTILNPQRQVPPGAKIR